MRACHGPDRPGAVLEAECDVVVDALHHELRGRVLEHESHAFRDADRTELADILAVELERPGRLGRDLGWDQASDGQRERALARTRRADDEQHGPRFEVEIDPGERRPIGARVGDAQPPRPERDRRQSGNPSSTPDCFMARWRATEPPATITTAEMPMNTPRRTWTNGSRSA